MPEWTERIKAFQQHLGGHDGARPHQLTLPELGALVVVAGRTVGFKVETEVAAGGGTNPPRIDCAWYAAISDFPIVVWEFDARDVGNGHLAGTATRWGTFEKLHMIQGTLKIQALYSIRGSVKKDGYALRPEFQAPNDIQVHTDETLMQGELINIAQAARRHARQR